MSRISNLFKRKLIKEPNYSIPRSYMEGISMNGMSMQRENYPTSNIIYFDSNNIEKENSCGGIIAFPTEFNKVIVIQPSEDELKKFVYQKLKSLSGIIIEENKVKHIFQKPENPYGFGFALGGFLKGKFHSTKENTTFECGGSLCIEIEGVEKTRIIALAEEICVKYKISCVLLRLYDTTINDYSKDYNIITNKEKVK